MQPLIYLAVRAVLGWMQFMERSEHAFMRSSLLLVAAGALHCWAVVYALFVAVHTRAMRYDGYHEGYAEHLPAPVAWSETLTEASLWIWLLAGFATAAIRILDEDAGSLPVGLDDTKAGPLTKIMRSPTLHSGLAMVHSVSCVGLFVGIFLLSITMAVMKGGITACEVCLVCVSIAFALPHVVIAIRRMSPEIEQIMDAIVPPHAMDSAAAEAAAIAPQLCVLLALADAPGHAYIWQNMLYFLAAIAIVAAIVASGHSPSQMGDTALPPETHETFTCLVMDAAAAMSMVLSFPHMNTWATWACILFFSVGLVAGYPFWREFVMDWLEPVFVVRSDGHKRLQGPTRQRLRQQAWVLALLCAATSLWDIKFHPTDQLAPTMMSKEGLLMLRWQPSQAQETEQMLATVAEALGLEANKLTVEEKFPDHRVLIFKHEATASSSETPALVNWKSAMASPKGKLAEMVDNTFPATLNMAMCGQVRKAHETAPDKDASDFAVKAEARAAYVAACDWWDRRLLGWGSNKTEGATA